MTMIQSDAAITISDLETLKVISDPLRLKIFQAVSHYNQRGTLCNVKQIADALDVPQANLYYHIKQLENQELLLVGETHIVSGIVEKLYRVRAYRLMLAEDLLSTDANKEAFAPILSGMINVVLTEMQGLLHRPIQEIEEKEMAVSRHTFHLSPTAEKEFSQNIERMLKEIETQESGSDLLSTERYTFFYVFYPELKN